MNLVVGYPIEHSLSNILHGEIYREIGVEAEWGIMSDPSIENIVDRIRRDGIELTAVTIPHKESVIDHLDEIDKKAKEIGAVNTIINKSGKLIGYNTDIVGIEVALNNADLKDKNVLLLGAGGAARPVAYYVNENGGKLFCYNRTKEKADKIVNDFGGQAINIEDLESMKFSVIINATPIGMTPSVNESPIDKSFFSSEQVAFDLVYNPADTQFLKEAKEVGAKVVSGLDMLVAQGIRQDELWLGRDIDVDLKEVKKILKSKI